MPLKHAVIVAVSDNGVIGCQGKLPWYLPADLLRFKTATMNNVVVVGRRTYDSLPKHGLPGRKLVVISTHAGLDNSTELTDYFSWMQGDVTGYCSYDYAKQHIEGRALSQEEDDLMSDTTIFWAGGSSCFSYALGFADEVLLTRVHLTVDGDAFFRYNLEELGYELLKSEPVLDLGIQTTFETWQRKRLT